MGKPVKTEAELITMAQAELEVHADYPDGIVIFVIRDGHSWEFRTEAVPATVARPGYPEAVAMLVQIGDHLSKQYDLKECGTARHFKGQARGEPRMRPVHIRTNFSCRYVALWPILLKKWKIARGKILAKIGS